MGGAPSSLSRRDAPPPSRVDTLELVCFPSFPENYFLLTPGIHSLKEADVLGDELTYLKIESWDRIATLFRKRRATKCRNGAFSVADPNGRLYFVDGMGEIAGIYYCINILCPENPRIHGLKGTVVVLERPVAANSSNSMGNRIFHWILGESTSSAPPKCKVKILNFDDNNNVDIITTSDYSVVVKSPE